MSSMITIYLLLPWRGEEFAKKNLVGECRFEKIGGMSDWFRRSFSHGT
jgi:hypothetical protein